MRALVARKSNRQMVQNGAILSYMASTYHAAFRVPLRRLVVPRTYYYTRRFFCFCFYVCCCGFSLKVSSFFF